MALFPGLGNQVQSGLEAQHRPPCVWAGCKAVCAPTWLGHTASSSGASGRDRRVETAPRAS